MSQSLANIEVRPKEGIRFSCLKKRLETPKISRLKLHDKFACKGWNSCSAQFELESAESECDITYSPTKYPSSRRPSNQDNYKKKPMLVEISNIESIFLQNKLKSSKFEGNSRPEHAFYDFVPKLNKEKLNVICQRKRIYSESSNFQKKHRSFQSKKHCSQLVDIANHSITLISDTKPIQESCNIDEYHFKNINNSNKEPNSSTSNLFHKDCPNKISNPDILTKDECNVSVRAAKASNTSILSSYNENESLKTVLKFDKKSLHFDTFYGNPQVHFKLKGHCEETQNHSVNVISDCSPDKKEYSDKNMFKKPYNLKNSLEAFVSNFSIMDASNENSDLSILIENSPEKFNSPKLQHTSVMSFKHYKNELLNTVSKKRSHKRLHSESFNLQDLQESFQVKKHFNEPLMTSDSAADLVSDYSPVKLKSHKKDICFSTLNKFKNLSEAFASTNSEEKCINKNCGPDVSVQDECKPINVKSRKALSAFSDIPFSNDKTFCAISEDKIYEEKSMSDDASEKEKNIIVNISSSEENMIVNISSSEENMIANVSFEDKSVIINNKAFMKSIKSSFQENLSAADKGSNWLQSLNWDQFSQSKSTDLNHDDQIGKKTLKNIVHGGLAEQMLKLQRKERSDKVIWNHKMNELKKKAVASSVTFTLTSILHIGYIIMTKSCAADVYNLDNILCNGYADASHSKTQKTFHDRILNMGSNDAAETQTKTFIVLFSRSLFNKLHLKIGDYYTLYPPWQILSVPTLPFPVILCAYFVDPIPKEAEAVKKKPSTIQSFPVMYKNVQRNACECEESVFSSAYLCNSSSLYGKSFCVLARIQRIWETRMVDYRVKKILQTNDYLSFSLLLQTQDGIFIELRINSSQLSEAYHDFLSDAEGKCFRFCDVMICHRYNLRKCTKLKAFIRSIQKHVASDLTLSSSQMFCYQFIPSDFCKVPYNIPEENFPQYCNYDVKPLSFLQKNNQRGLRYTFIGKVLFQNKEDFYISDESLLGSKLKKFFKLKFMCLLKHSVVGTIILIKEAINTKDYLFVDDYSSCEILSSGRVKKSLVSYESRLKKIDLITIEHVLSPLSLSSRVQEIVLANGLISQVDEKSAISWLECSFCFKDNLLEASNSVIYCENCACAVSKPVLKVKMDVTVHPTFSSLSVLQIQLLSSTIKRILKISEDNHQPECNISDVLKKSTGVLCCFVKRIESEDELKIFHLMEIHSC